MPEVNDALFYTDTAGDKAVKSTMNALYVDRVLENNSKQVLNRTRAAASSTVDGLKNPQSKSLKRSIEQLALKKKNAGLGMGSALRAKMVVEEERKQNTLKNNGGFDLWAEQPAAQVSAYVEGQIKKRVKKPIVKDTRPASVPSVAIPHPGVSYKPTENDHHAALIVAAGVEYEKVDRLAKIEQQLAYPAALDDLDEELFFQSGDEQSESENDETLEEVAPGGNYKRKTRVVRNRQVKEAQRIASAALLKEERSTIQQINHLKEIKKELTQKEQDNLKRLLKRQAELEIKNQTVTKRLAKQAFRPAPMEIQLADEISDTIRQLKPEGNLFYDRFKSLQQRQLIETRFPQKKRRRYKVKETYSHDYKRFE